MAQMEIMEQEWMEQKKAGENAVQESICVRSAEIHSEQLKISMCFVWIVMNSL